MDWTPAARLLAFIAGMLTLSSLMLMLSCLRSCFYALEPHNQKVFKNKRLYEFSHGSHILTWTLAMVAGLLAGPQVTCILTLPAMFLWTCFHYTAGGKPHAVMNLALVAALAYFGFESFPTVPPLEWTPAAIWMTILTFLTIIAPIPALMGGKAAQAQYDQKPYLKKQFCDDPEGLLSDVSSDETGQSYRRARELAWAGHLLGAGCCMAAAIISGGAEDLCLLMALPFAMNGYVHWLQREEDPLEKFGAFFCWTLAVVTLGLGISR